MPETKAEAEPAATVERCPPAQSGQACRTEAFERVALCNNVLNLLSQAKLPLEEVNGLFKAPGATVRRRQRAIGGSLPWKRDALSAVCGGTREWEKRVRRWIREVRRGEAKRARGAPDLCLAVLCRPGEDQVLLLVLCGAGVLSQRKAAVASLRRTEAERGEGGVRRRAGTAAVSNSVFR